MLWGRENRATQKKVASQSLTDAELVAAARRGDKHAFVGLVARHQAMVCGVALGILGDFAASEDAAQEAFLTAWRKLGDLRDPERLRPWLAQIARNAALAHLRHSRPHEPIEDAAAVADAAALPDEALASEEEFALVRQTLARLPETYRMPLVLYYREGQSIRSVAEILSLSEDAVKQRLSRGRELLRERMSGLVETALTRSHPTAAFTIAVAVAIGAMAAPAAIAGAAFAAGGATTTTAATPFLTTMSTTKTALIAATVIAVACVPVGYQMATGETRLAHPSTNNATQVEREAVTAATNAAPNFDNSALFAEWRQLHNTYGTTPDAMPAIYKAIAEIKDSFRRRAFRSALIAEWVQLDPAGGLNFFVARKNDASQGRHFFEEWLARDATNAVAALMASGPGWQGIAREALKEIARRVPARVAEIAAQLPKSESYWDTKVRDAFAIVAEGNLGSARASAEKITGASREQALAGVAQAWAKNDLSGAIAWARGLPEGIDRDEIIRAALLGKAAVDPAAALDLVGSVPPGGRAGYFATTTGARVLTEAARTDFDGVLAWIAEHPGRLGREDLMGLAEPVTDRLNADAVGFLSRHAADGTLNAVMPAIDSAILNRAGGQRATIWEWLKTQPENDATASLRRQVLSSAGYQDPPLAMKLAGEIPRDSEGDIALKSLALSLWNGGQYLARFDRLVEQAPDRLRGALVDSAFQVLRSDNLTDPEAWVKRLDLLPPSQQALGIQQVARAWGGQSPKDAVGWVSGLPANEARSAAVAAIASSWAAMDAPAAASWVGAMQAGPERDQSAQSLAASIAGRYPNEAWAWVMSISDASTRAAAAVDVTQQVARRDADAARQLIGRAQLAPELKAQLEAVVQRAGRGPR